MNVIQVVFRQPLGMHSDLWMIKDSCLVGGRAGKMRYRDDTTLPFNYYPENVTLASCCSCCYLKQG
jgi:hypothetical protein